jgi:hypothetical protein
MAGKYGPADVTVTLEDGPGGTARSIHNFILNGITAKDIARLVQTDALGDAWEEHTPTGKKAAEAISLEGIWDTTATTGTHVVLGAVDDGPQDDGRALVVVFGNAKTWTVDCRLTSYAVKASNDNIQMFEVELQPTGAAVWS